MSQTGPGAWIPPPHARLSHPVFIPTTRASRPGLHSAAAGAASCSPRRVARCSARPPDGRGDTRRCSARPPDGRGDTRQEVTGFRNTLTAAWHEPVGESLDCAQGAGRARRARPPARRDVSPAVAPGRRTGAVTLGDVAPGRRTGAVTLSRQWWDSDPSSPRLGTNPRAYRASNERPHRNCHNAHRRSVVCQAGMMIVTLFGRLHGFCKFLGNVHLKSTYLS